jgi:hypothetical protein
MSKEGEVIWNDTGQCLSKDFWARVYNSAIPGKVVVQLQPLNSVLNGRLDFADNSVQTFI